MESVRYRSLRLLILMLSMILITMAFSLGAIHYIVYKSKKKDLKDLSINQQNIINSIYKETNDKNKTLDILKEYFKNNPIFGKTGEYLIAVRTSDSIKYLIDVRHPVFAGFNSLSYYSEPGEPIKYALAGNTGILTGLDYRKVKVLAYCTYLPEFEWGMVTKMDISEVNIPFYRGGLLSLVASLILIFIGTYLFRIEFSPILNKVLKSEARYKNLFEYSAVPIWEINAFEVKKYFDKLGNSGITDFETYFRSKTGEVKGLIPLIEIISINQRSIIYSDDNGKEQSLKNLIEYFNNDTLDIFKKAFIELYKGANQYITEINFNITGEVRSFLAHISVMPGHAHDLSDILISFIEVTKHKESEALLLKNEARLKRSQEIAHLGSWEFDLIHNELTWTDEVFRIFGLTPGEFEPSYKAFLEAVHPDDRASVDNAYSGSVRANLSTYEIEHRIVRRTGEVRFVHEKCEHFRDDSGQITRSIGMVHDITDRKKAEKDLMESKMKLNLALENGKIGIWEWNPNTDELILDSRVEEMFGLEHGSYGRSYKALENMVFEEDISHLQYTIKDSIETDLPLESIFRIKSKTGKTKYLSARAFIRKDNTGKPVIMSGVAFDITDMREGTEKLILKLNEELLRSNKELERFAYVASHDLQEPLRMVTSFTQLLSLKYDDKLDSEAREYIGFAVDGAKRMYDLLNGLLNYSRIHTRGKSFNPVNLSGVIENTIKNLSLKIKERDATIISDNLPTIDADDCQMNQLFQNLIENSIKFSTESPRIYISSKSEPKEYIICIKDEGIGIDSKYFDRIFQIFQRLHHKEEFEGTGIGLAICKRIVERHGGTIWVESALGEGTTFCFSIPKAS